MEDSRNSSNTGRHAIVAATRPQSSRGINTSALIADDVIMLNARSTVEKISYSDDEAAPVSSSSLLELVLSFRIFSLFSSDASRRNLDRTVEGENIYIMMRTTRR